MFTKRCIIAVTIVTAVCTGSRADAQDDVPPSNQTATPATPTAPAFDNNDALFMDPSASSSGSDQGPILPPALGDRPTPNPAFNTPLVSPADRSLQQSASVKPTLAWRARVQRLSANAAPPVVRTFAGSSAAFFPALAKACGDAGFEIKGTSPASGELWIRRNYSDETAVRCNLYFAITEQPAGRVIVKASSDKNSASELKAANAILDDCIRVEADDDAD